MIANRPEAAAAADFRLSPLVLSVWLAVFPPCFTAPVWNHVLVLVAGAVLAPGKRAVTQALRVMGLGDEPGFGRYHEVLNRARWNARGLAQRLLLHVLDSLLPPGPVVIGIDDTIERRWVARIKACVLDADRQLLTARDDLGSNRADAARAAVRTFRALGGGWSAPVDARNAAGK